MLSLHITCKDANTHYNTSEPIGDVGRVDKGLNEWGMSGKGSCVAHSFIREGGKVLRAVSLSIVALACSAAGVSAQEWAEKNDAKGLPASAILADYMDAVRAGGATPVRNWDKE